jgi:hypothetical protein
MNVLCTIGSGLSLKSSVEIVLTTYIVKITSTFQNFGRLFKDNLCHDFQIYVAMVDSTYISDIVAENLAYH